MATQLASPHRFTTAEYHRMGELGVLPERGVELIDGRVVYAGGRPWRFTLEDYYRLAADGVLSESDHVELIDGEIVDMTPAGSRHAACVSRLAQLLIGKGAPIIVRVQDPLRVWGSTEVEPDLVVVRYREDFYAEYHPVPSDVLLVIEVSDSSVVRDRVEKAELYATVGIEHYLQVDLTTDIVTVRSVPTGREYRRTREFQRGDTLTVGGGPIITLAVDDILG